MGVVLIGMRGPHFGTNNEWYFGQPPTYTTMMMMMDFIIITVHGFVGLENCVNVKNL
jgi:hypothetical protein